MSSADAAPPVETSRAWLAMGTLIEVRVPDLAKLEAVEAIRAVRRRVEELESAMTLFREESPLVAFNRAPAGRWMEVPGALAEAAASALRAAAEWDGAFDPTVAPMMRAWGLDTLSGAVPSVRARREWRRRADWRAVEVDAASRRVRRLDAGVELDLGGIGKGIAVDEALEILRRAGSGSALVNFGGSIGVLGPPPAHPQGWPVVIAEPAQPRGPQVEVLLARGHLATSGTGERWVETALGRKHHILDPVTGEPAEGPASVTVWSATGEEADVASTAVFVEMARDAAGRDGAITPSDGFFSSGGATLAVG